MPKEPRIVLLKEAQKDLGKLDPKILERTRDSLGRLANNPKLAKKLSGTLKDVFSFRFGTPSGEYRVAFLHQRDKIIVLAIGPREGFYKTLEKRV